MLVESVEAMLVESDLVMLVASSGLEMVEEHYEDQEMKVDHQINHLGPFFFPVLLKKPS
jgi:hypothetical protein